VSPALLIATLGGIGRLPQGPTLASAAVLPALLLGPWACLALGIALAAIGWWAACQVVEHGDDPRWFVADEGAGMLLGMAALGEPSWLGAALALALFRAFDGWKPWPVSWADNRPGATGVMLDDLLAGAYVALALVALRYAGGPI
jgi:phosphatidylglycerophosphatase A